MKVRASAALLSAAALLVGCGRQHAPDGQPQQMLQIDTAAAPKSSRSAPIRLVAKMEDMKLPADGMSFTQARELLIGQGASLAPDTVAAPHPEYNELDCPDATADLCRALFVWKDKRGWGQYIVVETGRGAAPLVKAARWAATVDGLLSIPPPEAEDVPQLDKSYWSARAQLTAQGFTPVKASEAPYKVCAKEMTGAPNSDDCAPDTALPEVESCAGTGAAFCTTYWLAPDKARVLKITTAGEPQPGKIYFKEWATPKDLKALPSDWRP
jgi:hypothetical protein